MATLCFCIFTKNKNGADNNKKRQNIQPVIEVWIHEITLFRY